MGLRLRAQVLGKHDRRCCCCAWDFCRAGIKDDLSLRFSLLILARGESEQINIHRASPSSSSSCCGLRFLGKALAACRADSTFRLINPAEVVCAESPTEL